MACHAMGDLMLLGLCTYWCTCATLCYDVIDAGALEPFKLPWTASQNGLEKGRFAFTGRLRARFAGSIAALF